LRRLLLHIVTGVLFALIVAAFSGWGVLAIYFGNSHTSLLQTTLAVIFGAAGFATIILHFSLRWRRISLGVFSMLFALVLLWWFNIAPSNDRVWEPEVARLPYATIDGDLVTMHNIRDFSYRSETDFTPAYYSKTYDLAKLDSVDLFAIYWMGPAVAHTIISFGFGGEDYLAVSIEARKQQGEGYSTIKGFFRQYEQIYIAADERDIIRLRTNYRKDPVEDVYRYRLQGSPELARQFFLDYVNTMSELTKKPRFYNTLADNCTDLIWTHAHMNPGRIPFSWKLVVSGYAPDYLYEEGRLDTSLPFSELTKQGFVNPIAHKQSDTADFSRLIRAPQPAVADPAQP
jgi:hypothetical protein